MATPIIPLRSLLRACPASSSRSAARLFSTAGAGPSRLSAARSLDSPTTRLTPYFSYSHRFHPITSRTTTFFSPSFRRQLSTVTVDSAAFRQAVGDAPVTASRTTATTSAAIPKSLPYWLFGCSAVVFGIVIIGGLTRLTESGLSITEWNPITGILPPLTEEDWNVEWEKYRLSPEGIMTNSKIDMSEFKFIFYMEWAHRIAGRALGVGFIAPAVYYLSRYRLPRSLQAKLLAIGLGIGMQGVLGWYMVKSGLDEQIITDKAVPRVSQYRLAAHLSAALALYVGMLYTAIGLRRDVKMTSSIQNGGSIPSLNSILANPAIKKYRGLVHLAAAMVFFTAVSGAFVAGLDAGLVYNEFPTMGGRLVPPTDELLDTRYAKRSDKGDNWWRNMLENPVTAQFDHRLFATTTFTVLLSLPLIARSKSLRLAHLPQNVRRWANATAVAAVGQVTLGITTLLYLVPVPLAATHQAGSVVLLTFLMGLMGSLRKPGKLVQALQRHMSKSPKLQ